MRFTENFAGPFVADDDNRLARMHALNERGLRAFKSISDDDALDGNGAFLSGLGILPSSGNKLADDAREIVHLFHERSGRVGVCGLSFLLQNRRAAG